MVSDRTKFILYAIFACIAFLAIVIALVIGTYDELISGVMRAKKISCSIESDFWCYSFGVSIKLIFIPFFCIGVYTLLHDLIRGEHQPIEGASIANVFRSKRMIERCWFLGPLLLALLIYIYAGHFNG